MNDGTPSSAMVMPLPDRIERPDPQTPAYRIPPHNLEAEQALLGAILVNNGAFEHVSEFLSKEHFADPVNGRIYEACGKLIERGQMANPITLKGFFDQDGSLADVGGAQYLVKLAASVVSVLNSEDYGRTIYDLHLRRQLIDYGEQVVNDAFKHDLDISAEKQVEAAEGKLFSLAETGRSERGFQTFAKAMSVSVEMAANAYRREGKLAGVPSGFTDLDKMLGGLHYSDLLILAGRPAMGKTALATNLAFYAATREAEANDRFVVAYFSLEMSAEQLATRILAEQTEIPSEKIRKGELNEQDFQKLVQATHRLERTPLFIDDTPALPVSSLRTRARRLKRQHGLHLIVVDYLQLLQGPVGARMENRVQEISEITRSLKAIAKELHVPVLALSQLSRAVEQREDKRPQLADLRESGSIEQDADVVMFVFREEYYLARGEPTRRPEEGDEKFHDRFQQWQAMCEAAYGKAEVIIGKQRHGPTGKITLQFNGATTKFSNYISDDHLPDPH
ncbi:MAG: replicative DNA helicase [Alphaproteobacteria bacterium]|nr:replicative DNA helicase [Alphaproteobacteria bacterium]MBU0795596.1 replicative DNA helicase [Alphaproteobacteria bacterium]MBU0887653.1 replicative DNA helicase [Alphaproteobacteria bacterium]MBU1812920.1 replicative DNA helicase [Alphaproteobacteria bacterium]MBU2089110.1 replicative DNA helicase [Alphaproteobacteria bacterium]